MKSNNPKITVDSAIGQHLITNPECAKRYADHNFRIIWQARASFRLNVLESVYIKTQNQILCKQRAHFLTWTLQVDALFIISHLTVSGYVFRFTFRSFSDVSYPDEYRTKNALFYP